MKLTLDVPGGDTLASVVAGYLNEGTPSACLIRVLDGFIAWQRTALDKGNPAEDIAFAKAVQLALARFQTATRQAEDSYYHARVDDAADFTGRQTAALRAVAQAVR
jgi:hypothetical protein